MSLLDTVGNLVDSLSTALDTQDRDGQIEKLKKENKKLRFERDHAINLNNAKDDFVKSLGGRLLKEETQKGKTFS